MATSVAPPFMPRWNSLFVDSLRLLLMLSYFHPAISQAVNKGFAR